MFDELNIKILFLTYLKFNLVLEKKVFLIQQDILADIFHLLEKLLFVLINKDVNITSLTKKILWNFLYFLYIIFLFLIVKI